eukprot:14022217-Alexandrium_andersonii.AAC.1
MAVWSSNFIVASTLEPSPPSSYGSPASPWEQRALALARSATSYSSLLSARPAASERAIAVTWAPPSFR